MYDYLFFDKSLKIKFIKQLNTLNTPFNDTIDNDNLCISIEEDVDEDIVDLIDDFYDVLLDEQAAITISEEPESINMVGVQFTTDKGQLAQVKLEPKLVNKLHKVVTFSELQELVQTIATASLNPQIIPLCKKD